MDLSNITLAGLVTIGVVNVLTFYAPDMDRRVKFFLSFLTAFVITFVPLEIGNIVLEKAKVALEVAFASSGLYKIAQKAGGEKAF